MLLLGATYWWADVRGRVGPVARVLEIFGRHSITAYLLHVGALGAVASMGGVYTGAASRLSPEPASVVMALLAAVLVFGPIALMDRRGWALRL